MEDSKSAVSVKIFGVGTAGIDSAANWIAARWSGAAWRTVDWLMLAAVVFHAFMGMRTVVGDYTKGPVRMALTMLLYLAAFLIFAMGTIALVTFPDAVKVAS